MSIVNIFKIKKHTDTGQWFAREFPQAQIPLFMGPKILSQNNPSFSGLSVL
jgi:hypothetical protein